MNDVSEHSEKLVAEVKRRALDFVVDNPRFGNELAAIEAAMFVGASIGLEQQTQTLEQVNSLIETGQDCSPNNHTIAVLVMDALKPFNEADDGWKRRDPTR